MNKLFLSVFFIFILSLSLVSSQLEIQKEGIDLVPASDISGVSIQTPPTPEGNLNVNGSVFSNSSDFWDDLDDPSDLLLSQFSSTWVDTTFDFNSQSAINLAGLILTQDITLNPFNWLVPAPTLDNHTANKKYVDDAASSTAFDFFFNNESSNIQGFFNMTESDLGRVESSLTTGNLGAGTHDIFNWSSAVGQPEFNELRQGIYDVHIHIFKTGTKPVTITPKLYNISSDGLSRNLLVTFESAPITDSPLPYEFHGILSDPVMLADGDRLNLELEAIIGATGNNPTITIEMEGTTDSHLSIQTSTNAFEQIFLRRDGTTFLTGNWNYGGFNFNGDGNFTTTDSIKSTNYRNVAGKEDMFFYPTGEDGTQGLHLVEGMLLPTVDGVVDLGRLNPNLRFRDLYLFNNARMTSANIGTMIISGGSITDSTGNITFVNENLDTTGVVIAGRVDAGTPAHPAVANAINAEGRLLTYRVNTDGAMTIGTFDATLSDGDVIGSFEFSFDDTGAGFGSVAQVEGIYDSANTGHMRFRTRLGGSFGVAMLIEDDRSIFLPAVYDDNITSGTTRDLYIQDNGQLGFIDSSIDVKENIFNSSGANYLYDLRVVNFDYINGWKNQIGLIAEEVDEIEPRLVSYKRNITYDCFVGERGEECEIAKIETTDIPVTVNYGSPFMISSMLIELQSHEERIQTLEDELCLKDNTYSWCK